MNKIIFDKNEQKEIVEMYLNYIPINQITQKYGVSKQPIYNVLKENNILIGSIDVVGYINNNPEIGYMLKKEYWNKGYMSEACLRVIKFLFSLGFKKIYIRAQVENIASNRVIQKCGGKFIECKEVERPLKHDKVMLNSYEITEI